MLIPDLEFINSTTTHQGEISSLKVISLTFFSILSILADFKFENSGFVFQIQRLSNKRSFDIKSILAILKFTTHGEVSIIKVTKIPLWPKYLPELQLQVKFAKLICGELTNRTMVATYWTST